MSLSSNIATFASRLEPKERMPEVELPQSLNSEEVEGHPTSTDLGKRVVFFSSQDKREKYGVLRYYGVPEFAEGIWCGVELDEPQGRNNGSIHGIRYFSCEPDYGVFVPLAKVELDLSRRAQAKQIRMNSAVLSKEMANRLSQPALLGTRKISHTGVTNWRQPMKAFAPNGMNMDNAALRQQKRSKAVLPPFRAGGMYKAVSTENIRSLRDKDGSSQAGVKKSSSERDLRSGKLRPQQPRSPLRVSSTSNLTGAPRHTRQRSLDSSASPPPLVRIWPKTSTPSISRDDFSPDGCSSPESNDSCSSSSMSHEEDSPLPSTDSLTANGVGNGTNGVSPTSSASVRSTECAFLKTPDLVKPTDSDSPAPSLSAGLATHLTQFVESEKTTSKISGDCRVPSPEHDPGQPRFKNTVSGAPTLSHPLSLATNASEIENGATSNGSDCASESQLFELLLNSKNTTEEVSANDLLQLFRRQYSNWHSAQVRLENKISCLEKELDLSRRELQEVRTSCQRKLHEAESRHRQELRQLTLKLQKAHRRIMEGSGDHHHTTV